jgi:hypothetical protein
MRSRTVTAVLDADHGTVFDYLSDIERLREWATEFARELRREGDDYKVVNGLGVFYFANVSPPLRSRPYASFSLDSRDFRKQDRIRRGYGLWSNGSLRYATRHARRGVRSACPRPLRRPALKSPGGRTTARRRHLRCESRRRQVAVTHNRSAQRRRPPETPGGGHLTSRDRMSSCLLRPDNDTSPKQRARCRVPQRWERR